MKKIAAIVTALVFALSGCGSHYRPTDDTGIGSTGGTGGRQVSTPINGPDPYVTKVQVDGTNCVVANTNTGGVAISCDWSQP